MLKKLTVTVSYGLISLSAALFIAVGMPLLHPVLHSQLEHSPSIAGCGTGHLSLKVAKNHVHECPICCFLAASQLNLTVPDYILEHIEPVCYLLTANQTFLTKIRPLLTEPRAPPVMTALQRPVV